MSAPKEFAGKISLDVISQCINTGIFPSVVIAQAIEESGSGSSKLAQLYNNLFGHTASSSWNGKTARLVPNGTVWRWYDSIAQAIAAHINILKKPAYRIVGVINAKTPFEQALALQKGGYNAGPDKDQYALKLSKIIKGLDLQQYDQQLANIERKQNINGLAFHEQSPVTRTLHNLFS